jgi:hypothetical protein
MVVRNLTSSAEERDKHSIRINQLNNRNVGQFTLPR